MLFRSGKYKALRRKVHFFLLILFLALPWIHWKGNQLVLLDVAHREFFLFGLHFRSHDAPLVLFLLLAFTFLIGLITTIWGRVWCGWACPQTVFTESIYRKIEVWIEGNHRDRKALDEAPWTGRKVYLKSLKWISFTIVSLLFTHSFLAYFVGSKNLITMIFGSPTLHWDAFLVVMISTAIILFDFGWFREQFCVIMCPYGRFQSVLMDSQSMVVGYDSRRSDCVNCFRCVQVCPTGIDIRRGLQMECIACTACIDACDLVMEKIKKPKGLISYTTLADLTGKKKSRINVRAVVYGALLAGVVGWLSISLRSKDFLEIALLRAPGLPYEIINEGTQNRIVNHFRLDISNQTGRPANVSFGIAPSDFARGIELIFPMNPLNLADSASRRVDFFVRFSRDNLNNGSLRIPFAVESDGRKQELELSLVGPNN